MDLTKLLGNPMQDMMGQELANIFKRIGGGGQQGPMSPMQQPQMSQMPQQQYNPFGRDMQQEDPYNKYADLIEFLQPEMNGSSPEEILDIVEMLQPELNNMAPEELSNAVEQEFQARIAERQGQQAPGMRQEMIREMGKYDPFRERTERLTSPITEGFSPDEKQGFVDAFVESVANGANDEFMNTVRAEVGPEYQQELDDIIAQLGEGGYAPDQDVDPEYMWDNREEYIDDLVNGQDEADWQPDAVAQRETLLREMGEDEAADEVKRMGNEMQAAEDQEIKEALTLGSGNPSDDDTGEVDENGVPASGVSFDKMKAAEQNRVSKQMADESNKAQKLVKAHRTLTAMKKLVQEHPNMADEMGAVFANPAEQPGFLDQLKRDMALGVGLLNKKDLAAYEKFTKLSSELVLDAGEALGSKNFTDAKLKLIQRSKPSGRMTDEALNYVIDHMMYDWEPAQDYANAIEKGRRGRYQPEMNMESYRKGKKDLSIEEAEKLLAEMENG